MRRRALRAEMIHKENIFQITEPQREWVESNFKWLIKAFGYPTGKSEPIILNETYFPKTFKTTAVNIENIIEDLCRLLNIRESKITFETITDIRDIHGMPYEIEGNALETDLVLNGNNYKIYIAKNLREHPRRLVYCLVYEFVKIKLTDHKLQFDTGDDTNLFIYLAGIYFGFGVLLSQNLESTGTTYDGFWKTQWQFTSEIHDEIMAFGLATYSKLTQQESPSWKEELPKELKRQFEKAIDFLNEYPRELFDKTEREALDLFYRAMEQYQNHKIEEAILTMQKIIPLATDNSLRADVFNAIGYYYLRLGEYENSISYLKKAIESDPGFGYPNDNLGYVYIQTGEPEEGRKWIDKAVQTETNDMAYSLRNYALYYRAKGENELAEENFLKAFETTSDPVDLLEYHYAEFLFRQGRNDEGMKYLNIAIEKKEPEAVRLMNEMKKN